MRKILAFLLCLIAVVESGRLEVTAEKFIQLEKKNMTIFEGNAHVKDGKSNVWADKFIIYANKDSNASIYKAIGNVRFEINRPGEHFKGRCDRLIYSVKTMSYRLIGHAKVDDLLHKRSLSGDEILLDNKKHQTSAISDKKKPVKFVFQMEDSPIGVSSKKKPKAEQKSQTKQKNDAKK